MAVPYRTVLRLPSNTDVIGLAEQEVQSWLSQKARRLGRAQKRLIDDGAIFTPGVYPLSSKLEVATARDDRAEDRSRRLLVRVTESNSTGTYQVDVIALDYQGSGKHEDALIIEVERRDDPDPDLPIDPPRFVTDILARQPVRDGRTPVTSEPNLVLRDDVHDLVDYILDPVRSVSVIVACSPGRAQEREFRDRVADLTSTTKGAAAVFVVTDDAVPALAELLPPSHAVETGRVRTFLPKVVFTPPDGLRHRVLGPTTFARNIDHRKVSPGLRRAFAAQTRGALLDRPLSSDLRRARRSVTEALSTLERATRIEKKVTEITARAPKPSVTAPQVRLPEGPSAVEATWASRFVAWAKRWLPGHDVSAETAETDIDDFIAKKVATADELLEEAGRLEQQLSESRDLYALLQEERDDLVVELAQGGKDASDAQRQIEYLQRELAKTGHYDTGEVGPLDEASEPPEDVLELVARLQAGPGQSPIFERVEFTGDLGAVEEVRDRDQLGRYASALWDYVQVLYDYVGLKTSGDFAGNLYMYLNDPTAVGRKCSPQRHAPTESETVLSSADLKKMRMFPVPETVDASERKLMDAHFKPTHENRFAPRLHYYDDSLKTGKVYVGYIGRHLKNTKT